MRRRRPSGRVILGTGMCIAGAAALLTGAVLLLGDIAGDLTGQEPQDEQIQMEAPQEPEQQIVEQRPVELIIEEPAARTGEEPEEEPETELPAEEVPGEIPEEVPQEDPEAEPEEEAPSDEEPEAEEWLFYDSDSRLLTEEDIAGMTSQELRVARNEIYARHGRRFSDEKLQAYFDSLSWYRGTIDPADFDENLLNETERANVAFLKAAE